MKNKLKLSWWLSNGNLWILLFAIFGTIFTLNFSGWEFNSEYVDWDNPQWVRWGVLFFPWVVVIIKLITTIQHYKTLKK